MLSTYSKVGKDKVCLEGVCMSICRDVSPFMAPSHIHLPCYFQSHLNQIIQRLQPLVLTLKLTQKITNYFEKMIDNLLGKG